MIEETNQPDKPVDDVADDGVFEYLTAQFEGHQGFHDHGGALVDEMKCG